MRQPKAFSSARCIRILRESFPARIAGAILFALVIAALPAQAEETQTQQQVYGVNSEAGSSLPMGAGGSTFMYLTTTGSVGIGTSTPATTLEVNGTAKVDIDATVGGTLGVTGATTLSSLTVSGLTNTGTLNIGSTGPLTSASASTLLNLQSPSLNCGNNESLTESIGNDEVGHFACQTIVGLAQIGPTEVPDCAASNGALTWNGSAFTCITPAQYWTLSGSSLYNNVGAYVGIGTTAPTQPLTVAGAGLMTGGLFFGGNSQDEPVLYLGDDGSHGAILRVGPDADNRDSYYEFNANGQFQVLNGGATFDGDVSIATTTTATASLEVNNGSLGASDYCINGVGCSRAPVPKSFSCPTGQSMTGFDANGSPVCTATSTGNPCAGVSYAGTPAFDGTGNSVCDPICPGGTANKYSVVCQGGCYPVFTPVNIPNGYINQTITGSFTALPNGGVTVPDGVMGYGMSLTGVNLGSMTHSFSSVPIGGGCNVFPSMTCTPQGWVANSPTGNTFGPDANGSFMGVNEGVPGCQPDVPPVVDDSNGACG